MLLAFGTPGASRADTADLVICLEAKPTLRTYADAFTARGWHPVAEGDADHDRVQRATAEIVGTLRSFPVAFTKPEDVRVHVDQIVTRGRQAMSQAGPSTQAAFFARDRLALMVRLESREGEAQLTCTLSAPALPDVIRRLPEPGRNPTGDPLAWNVVSSGPLPTRHLFAEILYVRLFFQPAQHLLAGGDGIVTHLTFRHAARPT